MIAWLFFCVGSFGLLTSSVYALMVIVAAIRYRRFRLPGRDLDFTPFVSLFKPLHGDEPGLEERLRGFFSQDYPSFEILFCARQEGDAGLAVARKLAAEFPAVRTRFLTTGLPRHANAKVHSLELMHAAAEGEIFIISDSDAGVGPGYLRDLVKPFSSEKVGLVTCIYRGAAIGRGLFPRLEAIGMSVELTAGVIVSAMLDPLDFALGPTMAVRRRCVEEMGSFAVLGNYHSDDFVLGNLVARHGNVCLLSDHVIDHFILNSDPWRSLKHQVLWMKSTRFSRPKGHFGTVLTFASPFAIVAFLSALALGHLGLGLAALGVALLSRLVIAFTVGTFVVRERRMWARMWLYPLRDLLAFGLWLASYGSRRVFWRGEWYELRGDGLFPLNPTKRLV